MTKILIIYGTRYGSTTTVCKKFEDKFKENNFEVDLKYLKKPEKNTKYSLDEYDGIIIASGIAIGRWTKAIMNFVNENQESLKSYKKPLGIFVSCATAMNKEDIPKAKKDFLDKIIEPLGIKPTLSDAFGGLVDFTMNSKIGYVGKKALKSMMKKNPNVDLEGVNDFKDWDQIMKFADDFLNSMK